MDLARIMAFFDPRDFGERKLPAKMVVTRPSKPGQSTTVIYSDLVFDLDIPDETFSIRNLQD